MLTCAAGHPSESTDYCDVCGSPMGSPSAPPAPQPDAKPAASASPCPNCRAQNPADSLFCEGCGYDYTTGAMPRGAETAPQPDKAAGDQASGQQASASPPEIQPAAPSPDAPDSPAPEIDFEWIAEVWVDPEWYAVQQPPDPMPSPGLPTMVPLRRRSLLIGRPSRSRGITPDIDCDPDSGISRRQAQLTTDGRRWFVEDLDSANGTYIAPAAGPLPRTPIPRGRRELDADDRVYLGAWTRIVLRRATPEEKELYS